jgi:murein DD-endopeptidase MepM/ murein hydrolase activator NlpD
MFTTRVPYCVKVGLRIADRADMGRNIARQRLRCAIVLGLVSAVASGLAGCSNETSRFGGESPNRSPYANPYAERERPASFASAHYGSVSSAALPAAPMRPAHASVVESQPLPQVQPAYAPPPSYGSSPSYGSQPYGSSYTAMDQSHYGPSPSDPPYAPPRQAAPAYDPPRYDPPPPPAPRYYEPPPRSGYAPPPLHPVLDIPPRPLPDYSAAGSSAKLAHATAPLLPAPSHVAVTDARAPASAPLPAAPAQAAMPTPVSTAGSGQTLLPAAPVYTVARGDTLGRVAHRYHLSVKEVAVANGLAAEAPLKVGMQLAIPVRTPTFRPGRPMPGAPVMAQVQAPARPAMPAESGHYAPASTSVRVAGAEAPPAASVHVASPVVAPAEAAPAGPAFRWPARGRVINNYGARVNGSTNDGIDLAVPEGTAVRSADDGVVAYAGNELKGYGNLVLVRHANGFVTAYANGSELMVKRNDQVHKGQVVMKSGQSGNAAAPQLHFEIRKNSAPVDPIQFLPSDKTASAPL